MMEKVPKQQYVEIGPILFHNYDPINAHIMNTGKILVALKPKSPLYYVVYPISEANLSTTFNLLINLKQDR